MGSECLLKGDVEIIGRFVNSSNFTFLTEITYGDEVCKAVYKPLEGESPLHDFPPGLYKREVAAYQFDQILGWDLIPLTIIRDGPYGEGSFQLYKDINPDFHYFNILESLESGELNNSKLLPGIKKMCALDFMMNNTDRKAGHCLLTNLNELVAIDHGLCFHQDYKLRTVIWRFEGDELDTKIKETVTNTIDSNKLAQLSNWLTPAEIQATIDRCEILINKNSYPIDETGGLRYPWPLI